MFITQKQYNQNVKKLKSALLINKEGIKAVILGDSKKATEISSKIKIDADKSLSDEVFEIMYEIALSEYRADGEGSSTASFPQYNRVWCVGNLGSVFVDVKIHNKENGKSKPVRVHYLSKTNKFYLENYLPY
jgi:hypothetical protein